MCLLARLWPGIRGQRQLGCAMALLACIPMLPGTDSAVRYQDATGLTALSGIRRQSERSS